VYIFLKISLKIITITFVTMVFSSALQAQETVTDIDGNVYHTVTIGTQVWMKENLKTTRYNDGATIPEVKDSVAWVAITTTPAYCWYNNDSAAYKATYGALYNWYTVNTNKLCPVGWHVPTDTEWITLTTYLGGDSIAGGKLKETGLTHWSTPNLGADNTTGFTALPGGWLFSFGIFKCIGINGLWWSSSDDGLGGAWINEMDYNYSDVYRHNIGKKNGVSVRCLKDAVTGVNGPANKKQIPDKIELYQNYPNPFNPTTTIRYEIPKLSIVNLKIFDVMGREVATLVNEHKPAGSYSVQWNASNLPSGIYLYRLQAGLYSETMKLVLLK
jgi:uncharacterized protein (TIGR02145 family)